jgi:hypothetical protein
MKCNICKQPLLKSSWKHLTYDYWYCGNKECTEIGKYRRKTKKITGNGVLTDVLEDKKESKGA